MVGMSPSFRPKTENSIFSELLLSFPGPFLLQEAKEGVDLRPRRSPEVRESVELHDDGLRGLEQPWTMITWLDHFIKFRCFLPGHP
jgi:hypothetical protein